MASVHVYTSFNFHYLAKARVLATTLKRLHPDWVMHACLVDREPEGFSFDLASEPFDAVTWADDLDIPNLQGWLFGHGVIELCTAVKGTMLRMLLEQGADKVIYLDPDIAVLDTLQPIADALDTHDVVITPHQLTPDDHYPAILDNELCSSQYGIYNLGFVAVANRGDGRRFTDWWEKRLLGWCHDNVPSGVFVDQKWCDHVPGLFGSVLVLRDPGCNVASWNLSQRRISVDERGRILSNGEPLRFYHFTKLGPIGDTMTQRYARDNTEVYELWTWYRHRVMGFMDKRIPKDWWAYGRYADGQHIPPEHRKLFRSRLDLKRGFRDPFGHDDNCAFLAWVNQHDASQAA